MAFVPASIGLGSFPISLLFSFSSDIRKRGGPGFDGGPALSGTGVSEPENGVPSGLSRVSPGVAGSTIVGAGIAGSVTVGAVIADGEVAVLLGACGTGTSGIVVAGRGNLGADTGGPISCGRSAGGGSVGGTIWGGVAAVAAGAGGGPRIGSSSASSAAALSVNAQQRIARSAELRLTRNDPHSTVASPFAESPVTRKDTLSVSVVRIVALRLVAPRPELGTRRMARGSAWANSVGTAGMRRLMAGRVRWVNLGRFYFQ